MGAHLKLIWIILLLLSSHSLWASGSTRPTIIFVHGSPATGAQFQAIVNNRDLRSHALLVAPDRPGYGGEIKEKTFYDFTEQVLSLRSHINAYQGRVVLVGYSYGAIIAMKAAQIDPEKIESLVLISGVYRASYVANRWFTEPMNWLLPTSEVMPRSYRQSYREIINTANDVAHTMKGLSNIKARVFVVHGENDTMTPSYSVNLLSPLRPTIYIRKGLSHDLVDTDSDFLISLLVGIAR